MKRGARVFFTEYGEENQYQIQEVTGKGSYGVVGSERERGVKFMIFYLFFFK